MKFHLEQAQMKHTRKMSESNILDQRHSRQKKTFDLQNREGLINIENIKKIMKKMKDQRETIEQEKSTE